MNPLKFPISCSALGLGAALLTGCGGGGGGKGPTNPTPIPTATSIPTDAKRLLRDDFNGPVLDASTWDVYTELQTLQRTRFGFTPQIVSEGGQSYARMRLESFNPNFVGQFKGTEINSKRRFERGNGLEMTARLRAPGLPPGIILAFFGIFDRFTSLPARDETYNKDEIDFEVLTAQQEQFSPEARNRLYLNVWNDWNPRNQFDEGDEDDSVRLNDDKTYGVAKAPGYDYANFNIYTIRWFPDRTEFYVNGTLERTEREVKPDEDLSVHFNMWTGNPDFRVAYSAGLQPARTAAENKTYTFDVDYVEVRDLTGSSALTARKMTPPPLSYAKSGRSR